MISAFHLQNFGPVRDLTVTDLQPINLLIGHNGAGKTFVLKALYTVQKSIEAYQRGNEPRSLKDIVRDKLTWVFQPRTLGDLVMKNAEGRLQCEVTNSDNQSLAFSFSSSSVKTVGDLSNSMKPYEPHSIFIPAKEILSVLDIIIHSRENDSLFGFDDTYLDLARALRPSVQGRPYRAFAKARRELTQTLGGSLTYDRDRREWIFKDLSRREFSLMLTSEGIKKISILDALLGNRYLLPGSIVFIDEVEANLHPAMIAKFLDIINLLASNGGIQFFLSTHSYFVIKDLFLLAQRNHQHIPVLSFSPDDAAIYDLLDDMPQNPIIDESVRLYRQELGIE